jgi:hypothetical protein
VVGRIDVDQPGMLGYAGIAGRGEQLAEQRRLRELPGERMFAAARAKQQDIHGRLPSHRQSRDGGLLATETPGDNAPA